MALLRVVLDTNVLVSGSAYPASIPGKILQLWRGGAIDIVLSHYILDELTRVLPRFPRFQFADSEIRDLIDSFISLADLVEPDTFDEPTLRDPADQQVLATLRASNADYLITSDKDLLTIADRYPILTPAAFWSRHS